jgi:hypothetical protein
VDAPSTVDTDSKDWPCQCEYRDVYKTPDFLYRSPAGQIDTDFLLYRTGSDRVMPNTGKWGHTHHRLINRAVYEVLRGRNLILPLRKRAQIDLREPDDVKAGKVFGKIALKSWAEAVVTNFLTLDPNPMWM